MKGEFVGLYVTVEGVDCTFYDWWTRDKQYPVHLRNGVCVVYSDDGDLYSLSKGKGKSLAKGGWFRLVDQSEVKDHTTIDPSELIIGEEYECKHKDSTDRWKRCRVIGVFGDWVWFMLSDSLTPYSSRHPMLDFRPIQKSEEEKIIEQAADTISKEFNVGVGECIGVAHTLYDIMNGDG